MTSCVAASGRRRSGCRPSWGILLGIGLGGVAFVLRSVRAERWAGYFVVATIFVSALVAGYTAIDRLIDPRPLDHLWTLAAAGLLGFVGD